MLVVSPAVPAKPLSKPSLRFTIWTFSVDDDFHHTKDYVSHLGIDGTGEHEINDGENDISNVGVAVDEETM